MGYREVNVPRPAITVRAMEIVRIYTGPDGQSHFEDVAVELADMGAAGRISERWPGRGVQFREVGGTTTSTSTSPRGGSWSST